MPFLIHLRKSEQRTELDYFSKKWALKFPPPSHLHLLLKKLRELSGQNIFGWSHLLVDVLIVLKVHSSTLWGWFFLASEHEKTACLVLISSHPPPIAVTMCMSLCGRKWGNTDDDSRSYQLALFLPLQSFCLPILEVWSPCLSLRLHSFSSCPQK